MSLPRRDLLALLVVLASAVVAVVVWNHGGVDMGLTLRGDGARVYVQDVTPDGNAARAGFQPGPQLIDLTTTDGVDVARGEPLGQPVEIWYPVTANWNPFGSVGAELVTLDANHRLPVEAIDSNRIQTALEGYVDPDTGMVETYAGIGRNEFLAELRESIWVAALGVLLGLAVWRALAHGIAGQVGRENAVLAGSSAAAPFLMLPALEAGTAPGIFATYLVPAGLALLLGISIAWRHADPAWQRTSAVAAVVIAGLAAIFVLRYVTSPVLAEADRGGIFTVIGAIAVVPALVSTSALQTVRERAGVVSLALVPVAALSVIGPSSPEPMLAVILVTLLLGWQLLPIAPVFSAAASGFGRIRPATFAPPTTPDRRVAQWRDRLLLGLAAVVVVPAIFQSYGTAVILGAALGGLTGFVIRRGLLGDDWTDAAIPLGVAVGVPVVMLAFEAWQWSGAMGWASAATGFSALGVAHLLTSRHSDPLWRSRFFAIAAAMTGFAILIGGQDLGIALLVVAVIPLVPGVPIAFARDPAESHALTARLETLAVALTPGIALLVLPTGANILVLGGWLVAVFVWRQFTLTPLVGLAQRTQLQRDLAVAAAETERARLAADLHDDALQQLTMLVRTLDDAGQKEAADEAREVATKLRSIVGDLRLPILDDLGAGAALEWLVERVEPLAGGPVKLERSDATRPPQNVELAVFRVAQEALTNAIKHGKPPIAVRYDVRIDGRVTLAIDDAGEGIPPEAGEQAPLAGHFGLANMQQRAEQIGALLDVRRWPAGGTRVALEWRPS